MPSPGRPRFGSQRQRVLVSFENCRIEISFNESLDKDFIKILSSKLLEWTGERWLITLSKKKGDWSIKEKELQKKKIF